MNDDTFLEDSQKKIFVSLTHSNASKPGVQFIRKNITQIQEDTGISRSHLSKTLKRMKQNGWLKSQEQGRSVKYRVSPDFEEAAEKEASKQRDKEKIESTELAEMKEFEDSLDQIPLKAIIYGHPETEENILSEKIQLDRDEGTVTDILKEVMSKIYEKRVPILKEKLEERYAANMKEVKDQDSLKILEKHRKPILDFLTEAFLEKENVLSSWLADGSIEEEAPEILSYMSDSNPETYEVLKEDDGAEKFVQEMARYAHREGREKMMLTLLESDL